MFLPSPEMLPMSQRLTAPVYHLEWHLLASMWMPVLNYGSCPAILQQQYSTVQCQSWQKSSKTRASNTGLISNYLAMLFVMRLSGLPNRGFSTQKGASQGNVAG